MVTEDQLRKIFIHAKPSAIQDFTAPLNAVMEQYEITTPLRQAHFLAQIGHESGELRYRQEIASGKAYEGRVDLGNTQAGDGRKFKGRGLIQLTGRANYDAYGRAGGCDLLASPERVADEERLCTDVAGWFWAGRKLNALADKDDLTGITKRINGGLNGLDDRKRILKLAKEILLGSNPQTAAQTG